MNRRVPLTALLLLSSTTFWACEREPAPATEEQEAAAEATGGAASIAGSILTTIISPQEAGSDTMAVGTWDLELREDGTFQVSQNANVAVQGRYTIEGDRITFNDEGGPAMCAEQPTGTYQWSVSGDQVTMMSVGDTCSGRLTVLTSHPLTRQTP